MFNPELQLCVQTRAAFEAQLRSMSGIEFVVAHDPLEKFDEMMAAEEAEKRRLARTQRAANNTPSRGGPRDTPTTTTTTTTPQIQQQPSNIWVIRKQLREKPGGGEPDRVSILATYFVIGESIFMASSVYGVVGSRMLSSVTSLSKAFGMVSRLPLFSAAHGNTYMPPKEPENSLQESDAMGEAS